MTDKNGTTQSIQTWPVPEFHFSVEISNVGKIFCKEVSGLDVEFDVIEYRPGDMPGFTRGKMPGLAQRRRRDPEKGDIKRRQDTLGLDKSGEDEHYPARKRDHCPDRRKRHSGT